MQMVENRMVVDSEWVDMEKEEIEPGCFDRWGGFVKEENLLECAIESVTKDPFVKDFFLDKVLDYIESDEAATEKFLKWFYPDYKEG